MNYYVIVRQNDNPATMTAYTSGNEAKNKNDAYAQYHAEMGYRHESRTRTEAIILDSNFYQIEREVYIKETD